MSSIFQNRLQGFLPRLFLYFFLPATVILIGVILYSQSLHHQSMQQLVGDRNLRAVRTSAIAIKDSLANLQVDLINLAGGVSDNSINQEALPWLDSFPNGAYQLDCETGNIHAFQKDPSGRPPEAAARDLCNLLKDKSIGEVAYKLLDGNLWLGTPMPKGVVFSGGISLDDLLGKIIAIPSEAKNLAIMIYDTDHNLIYETGRNPIPDHELYHQRILTALAGQTGVNYPAGDHASHGSHVIAFTPIQPVDWVLITDEAWEDIATPSLNLTQSLPLALIPLLALAILGIFFGIRQVIQPLQRLQEQAKKMGNTGRESTTEAVGGIREIQDLQLVLEDMSLRLSDSQKHLQEYIGALTEGVEAERKTLSRDLHDDALQDLIALKQKLQSKPDQDSPLSATDIQQVIDRLRGVIRGLRPPYLEDLGLSTALKMLASETSAQNGLIVDFHQLGEEQRLEPHLELVFYRIAQEALVNIRKHANAKHAWIELKYAPQSVNLQIRDDGQGFIPPNQMDQFAGQGHYGLMGMKERADLAGAVFELVSAPGKGTSIHIAFKS